MDQYHYSAECWLNAVALEGSYRLLARSGRLAFARPRKGACSCAARPLLQDLSFFRLFLLRPRLKLRSALMSQRSLVINTCMTKFRPLRMEFCCHAALLESARSCYREIQ